MPPIEITTATAVPDGRVTGSWALICSNPITEPTEPLPPERSLPAPRW
jgi:hypothetical protein